MGKRKAQKYEMKPLFEERMKKLLTNSSDFSSFNEIIHKKPRRFIRCNTLKIKPEVLIKRLREKWEVSQPFFDYEEIMLVEGKSLDNDKSGSELTGDNWVKVNDSRNLKFVDLEPGELGNSLEHLLGYFYVQEISSMLPIIALKPRAGEFILDLCASPGSKTTQMAALMENKGTIIANDIKLDRVKILNANLERCGVSNVVITRNDGVGLCNRLSEKGFKFDKILLDAPCSGEGTLRSSPKTFKMWNFKVVNKLSREQKKLFASAIKCLKVEGEIVYSTCTHSPEENEAVVDFVIKNFDVEVVGIIGRDGKKNDEIVNDKSSSELTNNDGRRVSKGNMVELPLICRSGVINWGNKEYDSEVERCCRIYPHDNDSEGFFVSKFKLKSEVKDKYWEINRG